MQDKEGSDNQKGLKLPPNRDKRVKQKPKQWQTKQNFFKERLYGIRKHCLE